MRHIVRALGGAVFGPILFTYGLPDSVITLGLVAAVAVAAAGIALIIGYASDLAIRLSRDQKYQTFPDISIMLFTSFIALAIVSLLGRVLTGG